ncbi:hypothetical protein SAMN04487928_12052 [Butyrivibrio proteoclasticus]|uniref:DUF5050 domain-containing protein n=1 Tax=Butyrivibrio proteoclasticus TaxID=43305 RepID=A0A1I5W365_9FIRM|nr:hypothetical protein [Butyrivibrio proteoclasticus]SFQ14165.1 hypothetical protein SAMN04487928_12052 [Butyrivibrio proteoclasticus]
MKKTFLHKSLSVFIVASLLSGCNIQDFGNTSIPDSSADSAVVYSTTLTPAAPFNGASYIEESSLTSVGQELADAEDDVDIEDAIAGIEIVQNYDTELSVPTFITKQGDNWFIVDCYHNRVIYSQDLNAPLDEWYIMSSDATQPHTIASDGTVYMIDDTENNRVLVYEIVNDKFVHTQTFYDIGNRPHYTVYNEITDTFYVWSSTTGELYCFRHTSDSSRMYLTDIRKIDELDGIYVRSFSIIDGYIYFVSGVSDTNSAAASNIIMCDLDTLEIKEKYTVPAEIAGMVQITKIQDYYYISVSTDTTGSQDFATIIKTASLSDLSQGKYEDIYSEYFIGGGTPYYISNVDDTYFLTEHRLKGHSIWSFKVTDNNITDVTSIF